MSKKKSRTKDTKLTNAIEATDGKPMYDESCKRILADKGILSWIMKECVAEYKEIDIKEIINYIEGTPAIGEVEIFTGKAIQGLSTEIIGNHNRKIFFDIRYRAFIPKEDEMIELIINIEAQNDQYPGYPLVKRGLFYDCMMISNQYGTEFPTMDYNKIKKVYSIWLCRNAPLALKNTITAYELNERNIVGDVKEAKENYDLMSVVMVHLGEMGDESESRMLNMLNKLFSEEIRAKEKIEVLENEYDIPTSEELESEVMQMCNWSKTVEDRATAKGMAKGIAEGRDEKALEMAKAMLQDGNELELIAKYTKLSSTVLETLKSELLD